jgi:hypothetical protein
MEKESQVERRAFVEGALAFLGFASLSALGCSRSSEFDLSEFQEISTRVSTPWSPPPEVVRVGKRILSSTGGIREMLQDLETKLSAGGLKSSASIADALRAHHLEAAGAGQWVEVRGWRITSIEAAAYAMCALAAG